MTCQNVSYLLRLKKNDFIETWIDFDEKIVDSWLSLFSRSNLYFGLPSLLNYCKSKEFTKSVILSSCLSVFRGGQLIYIQGDTSANGRLNKFSNGSMPKLGILCCVVQGSVILRVFENPDDARVASSIFHAGRLESGNVELNRWENMQEDSKALEYVTSKSRIIGKVLPGEAFGNFLDCGRRLTSALADPNSTEVSILSIPKQALFGICMRFACKQTASHSYPPQWSLLPNYSTTTGEKELELLEVSLMMMQSGCVSSLPGLTLLQSCMSYCRSSSDSISRVVMPQGTILARRGEVIFPKGVMLVVNGEVCAIDPRETCPKKSSFFQSNDGSAERIFPYCLTNVQEHDLTKLSLCWFQYNQSNIEYLTGSMQQGELSVEMKNFGDDIARERRGAGSCDYISLCAPAVIGEEALLSSDSQSTYLFNVVVSSPTALIYRISGEALNAFVNSIAHADEALLSSSSSQSPSDSVSHVCRLRQRFKSISGLLSENTPFRGVSSTLGLDECQVEKIPSQPLCMMVKSQKRKLLSILDKDKSLASSNIAHFNRMKPSSMIASENKQMKDSSCLASIHKCLQSYKTFEETSKSRQELRNKAEKKKKKSSNQDDDDDSSVNFALTLQNQIKNLKCSDDIESDISEVGWTGDEDKADDDDAVVHSASPYLVQTLSQRMKKEKMLKSMSRLPTTPYIVRKKSADLKRISDTKLRKKISESASTLLGEASTGVISDLNIGKTGYGWKTRFMKSQSAELFDGFNAESVQFQVDSMIKKSVYIAGVILKADSFKEIDRFPDTALKLRKYESSVNDLLVEAKKRR